MVIMVSPFDRVETEAQRSEDTYLRLHSKWVTEPGFKPEQLSLSLALHFCQ